MMPALDPASSVAGASSTSSTSSSIPPAWVADAFKPERTIALKESIRGMEAQLADLVFQSSSPGQWMDWLRVPLACATVAGNLAVVKRLLTAGVTLQSPSTQLRPPPLLHEAAKSGNESVVDELLLAGANVHEKDSSRYSRTALHSAAAAGGDAVVRTLIRAGADVDVLDARGRSPLHDACAHGHRSVVVFLLLNGACAQNVFEEEEPPLHLAAINNHPGVIRDLLSFGNVSVGCYNAQGRSALHLAAQYHAAEACVALLQAGAALGPVSSTGYSCLDMAAWSGQTGQVLQVLTAADAADVRKRNCSVALLYAVCADRPNTIRDLVALGGDVEYRSADTAPYLHAAVVRGAVRAAEALLLGSANVEAMFAGKTPLQFACALSHIGLIQLLLHWGADEKAHNSGNITARELVGIVTARPDEGSDEFIRNQLVDDSIRKMLDMAPADRIWRRRGWLVLCRARWSERIGEREKRSCDPLENIRDGTTGAKKRRGTIPGSGSVNPRDFSVDEGKAHRRNGGGGRHLPAVTSAAMVLSTGTCDISNDGGVGQAAGVAELGGRPCFVAVVEQLLLLREDSIFREVMTFL